MATLTMPSDGVAAVRFGNRRNTIRTTSPFTRSSQIISRPGDQWFATYELAVGTKATRAEWQVFLMQASNTDNRFKAYEHGYEAQGTTNGTPLVNGADQTGTSLITDGWANSKTVLKAGDYISVNDELKVVTADVTSDGSGNATINFEPKIRVSPDDNEALITTNPHCLMRLIDDEQAQWDVSPGGFYRFSFSAEESFFNG